MERFVLERESALYATLPAIESQTLERHASVREKDRDTYPLDSSVQNDRSGEPLPIFTYLEGKVYDYLRSHIDQVCDREEIKKAVWSTNAPGDSALQKIIERIRDKIEHEMENPPHLIAVRRRGYMLRYTTLEDE
jgi:DNA-binding response OmpR family regulator